jgi:DNA polymerase III epsilon subunit-like protein
MRDKLYAYLKLQETGATSSELVERVLKIKGASQNISEKLIRSAVAEDRRFVFDKQYLWKVVDEEFTPLSEATFVFLSLLTLETPDKTKAIVEVSAQKLKNDKIVDRLHLLIDPGLYVISSVYLPADFLQEVKNGILVAKAIRSLFHFIEDAVLVGYEIQSSINQVNNILNTSYEYIENASLCLKYLTKKLIPDICPKSLDDIASFFKIPTMNIRRTEKEVCIVAEIFFRYKELLKGYELDTLEEVLEFQYPEVDYVDFSKYAFDKSFLQSIPQKPGIYKMKRKDGELIYVGKAKNLKTRVSSYFWNTVDRLQKITDLLSDVYTIEYEVAGSELAAMLTEFRLIKQYRPALNQQYEVHERAARYGNLQNFIVILPSSGEGNLELFFMKEGMPLQRYEMVKGIVNFSEAERIIEEMYYAPVADHFLTRGVENSSPHPLTCPGSPSGGKEFRMTKISPAGNTRDRTITDIEMGEIDILLSWIEANKDWVNYINTDTVCSKNACLKLLMDYVKDEETLQKKHFRFS